MFLIISSVKVEGGRVVIKEEFFFVVFRRVWICFFVSFMVLSDWGGGEGIFFLKLGMEVGRWWGLLEKYLFYFCVEGKEYVLSIFLLFLGSEWVGSVRGV